MSKVIRGLKDVAEVAQKMFPCKLVRLDEPNAAGKMGVKLIVGLKPNPNYDINANPDKPGLNPQERDLEKYKARPSIADTRIVWLRQGITADELVKEHLMGIKTSINRNPVLEFKKQAVVKQKKTDEELADELAKGDMKESVDNLDFDDETTEVGFEDESESAEYVDTEAERMKEEYADESDEDREPYCSSKKSDSAKPVESGDELVNAIKTLNDNVNNLYGDFNKFAVNIEDRVNSLEKKPKAKKKK
jgi:hypothetical protein